LDGIGLLAPSALSFFTFGQGGLLRKTQLMGNFKMKTHQFKTMTFGDGQNAAL
jgi:hypothetical protein